MIVDRIFEWTKRQPDKPAIIYNDIRLSYQSFSNAIQVAYNFFQREALPSDGTAIVVVDNLLEGWIILMALRSLGLNTICANSIPAAQSLKISDVVCIIITQTEAPVRNLTGKATGGAKIAVMPTSSYSTKDTNDIPTIPSFVRPFGGHILYTSGTTGTYKKVLMNGADEDQRNHARAQFLSIDRKTVYHGTDFGLWTSIGFKTPSATWHKGGCVVLDQRKEKFEKFLSHGITFAMFIPGMLKELLQARDPLARPIDGFAVAVGGGVLPIEIAEQCTQKLTDTLTLQYSSTEISSARLQ
jgi:non-ribosomal peptide synthetase component E (peptide arylation enzyme)